MNNYNKLNHTTWDCQLCAAQHNWQTGVKLPNLPSASFTSSGFLNFVMTPYVVWAYFLFLDLKFKYMGECKINIIKIPFYIIGDKVPPLIKIFTPKITLIYTVGQSK